MTDLTASSTPRGALTLEERMARVQTELEARGMKSFGITFAPGFESQPVEDLKRGVLHFLEDYLDGKCKPAGPLGDSKIAETPLAKNPAAPPAVGKTIHRL